MRFAKLDTLLKLPAALQQTLERYSQWQAQALVQPVAQRILAAGQAVRFKQTLQRPARLLDRQA